MARSGVVDSGQNSVLILQCSSKAIAILGYTNCVLMKNMFGPVHYRGDTDALEFSREVGGIVNSFCCEAPQAPELRSPDGRVYVRHSVVVTYDSVLVGSIHALVTK